MSISIVIADDHQIVRKGIRALLEMEQGFCVVGEASDGLSAVQMVEKLEPDILILDLMMPGLGGLEVARQVYHRKLKTRIIVLSMHANEAYVLDALRNGVSGYVLKDASTDDLVNAVNQVAGGQRFLSAPISERAIQVYIQKASEQGADHYESLTEREREVLHLVAEGLSSAEIATRLSLSSRTVEDHRNHLMRKLNLHNQTDLIRYALRRGIIE
jgi:DNA-binding NarL/FixJ family response regulator